MATQVIKTTFQLKRGLAEAWERNNPILAQGEPGFELDTYKLKIGDGVTPYRDLPYQQGDESVIAVGAFAELPVEGNSKKIYLVTSEKTLYVWDTDHYEQLTISETIDASNITQQEGDSLILYGGFATDNI